MSKKTKPDNDRDPNKIPEVASPPLDIVSQHVAAPGDADVQELQATIDKLKARVQKYKNKVKELKEIIAKLQQQNESVVSEDSVELHSGSGIFLPKTTVAAAKLSSKSPPILARNLFRHLFTPKEMKEHSLFGRICNANKASPALPAVDGATRDALIEYSLAAFNLKPNANKHLFSEYGVQKTKILNSLTKLLREKLSN
ncbi:unnamed protein product [Allacma fusca]|uniref:BEN domain-containing protein n=1 Tax=Allacma fusca TaxID=39272 RepID=A0A8J2LCI8_9HEXA|nr:unnamed protein product [Allacma fusca]